MVPGDVLPRAAYGHDSLVEIGGEAGGGRHHFRRAGGGELVGKSGHGGELWGFVVVEVER